jgi:hypothetical protein
LTGCPDSKLRRNSAHASTTAKLQLTANWSLIAKSTANSPLRRRSHAGASVFVAAAALPLEYEADIFVAMPFVSTWPLAAAPTADSRGPKQTS